MNSFYGGVWVEHTRAGRAGRCFLYLALGRHRPIAILSESNFDPINGGSYLEYRTLMNKQKSERSHNL